MQKIPFKRGDTFSLLCTIADDVTGWTIASQVRKSDGTLVDTLVSSVISTSANLSEYTLSGSGATTAWPVDDLRCDIQYTTNTGIIDSTETFIIQVSEDITR